MTGIITNPYFYFSIIHAMKLALFLCFTLPIFAHAQDSTKLACKLTTEIDPFTKEKKISTGFIHLDGADVTIDATKTDIDFLFSVQGADRCYDNESPAYIFFEGTKVKLTMRNGGSMNCEGLFHFIYKNSLNSVSLLIKLSTQKVSHILFTGNNKKEADIVLTPNDQQSFMSQAACLFAEAKTLLQ
jgi:hypothetical protein